MFYRFSVFVRLAVAVVIPLVALTALATVSLISMNQIEDGAESLYQDRVRPLQQLKTISDLYAVQVIDAVNKAHAGMIDSGDALAGVRQARAEVGTLWQGYRASGLSGAELELAKRADGLFAVANADLDALERHLAGLPRNAEGLLGNFNGPLYLSIDPISETLDELVNLHLSLAERQYNSARQVFEQSLFLLIGTTLLVVILVTGVGWFVSQSIVQPLIRMRATLAVIARDYDLKKRVPVYGSDEIAATAKAVNHMLERFGETLVEINGLTDQLATASEELSAVSAQTTANLDNQGSRTEQVASAVEQMRATVEEVSRNTAQAASASELADQESKESGRQLQLVVQSIGQLSGEIEQITDMVNALAQKSEEIDNVLNLIRGIAEQTNLLALNAAIEAARAGETGRGFAVVADEVRALARRTQESIADIGAMTESLQRDTKQAADAMNRGLNRASETAQQAQAGGQGLERIMTSAVNIRDMILQISTATDEQASVAVDINQNVSTINDITRENIAGARQTASASEELAMIAGRVRELAVAFRVS